MLLHAVELEGDLNAFVSVFDSSHLVISGCGVCKSLKPDYALAATELKNEAVSKTSEKTRGKGWEVLAGSAAAAIAVRAENCRTFLVFHRSWRLLTWIGRRTNQCSTNSTSPATQPSTTLCEGVDTVGRNTELCKVVTRQVRRQKTPTSQL